YQMKDAGFFRSNDHFITYVNQFTIHMLSSLVNLYLNSIKPVAMDEHRWLTYWYQKVLSS
ncbi:MAG: hypothetical protein MUO97_03770, partial [Dehalococcoidia bacterium]|nr:hypothetical protein [Dehalococcoidia bacterium]